MNALELHWWLAITEMFCHDTGFLQFHCIVLYPGFVDATLLFGFHTADWSTFCFIWMFDRV